MQPLGYTHYSDFKKKFTTFVNKLLAGKKSPPYVSSTYVDSVNGKSVETFYLTRALADAPFAKADGMLFKDVLTTVTETLQIGGIQQKYLTA